MVCGCSWSMKIAERSSATADQLPQFLENRAAQIVTGDRLFGRSRDRHRLRRRRPWLQPFEVAERLVDAVGEPRPLHQVPRLEVLGQARAAEEAGADGHRRREV